MKAVIINGSIANNQSCALFAFSYGFLIPIFLLNLGMTTNITSLFAPGDALLTSSIVISLIISKPVGGFLGAKLAKFPSKVRLGMAFMTVPQMSTTLATASIAATYGIFSESLLASLVVLSLVTIIFGPFLIRLALRHGEQKPSRFEKLWLGTES